MSVYNTNIGWNFLMSREAAKQMKEKGDGSIIFIGSNSAVRVTENRCAYCSSKSGMIGMVKSLAVDFGRYGIRCNCVLPGMIKTERWENNVNNAKYCLSNYTPLHDIDAVSYTHLDVYKRQVQTYAFYNEVLKDYPACRKILKLYHPDLQGPFDTAHLIYGSDIYPDLYDEPELIHALLSVVTETYIRLFRRIYPYLSNVQEGSCYHWDMPVSYTHLDVYKRQAM